MTKLPTDKKLHILVSIALAVIVSAIAANAIYSLMPDSPGWRTAISYGVALLVTLAVGVWKEVCDGRQEGNRFDWADLAADAAGALLGSLGAFVSYLI